MTITTEAPTLTLDALFDTVRGLLTESPDFTYQPPNEDGNCVYIYEGEGSCVVGQALVALGLPTEEVAEFDHDLGGTGAHAVALRLFDVDSFHNPKAAAVDVAQGWQDGGHAWGGVLPVFEAVDKGATASEVRALYTQLYSAAR